MRYVLCVGVALSLVAGSASAQSVDTKALAEQLFNQARDLAKAGQWAEACPKFEASLRYDPVLGTKLNLATCYEHVGKLASAWGLYRDAIELAKKAGDAKRVEYAQKQASALEPRLPTLRISVAESPPPGLVVQRDGIALDAAAFGTALYVDPGAHEVIASAPGFTSFKLGLTLVEGKTETLAIPALVKEPVLERKPEAPEPAAARRLELTEAPPPPSRTRRYAGIGLGAAGLGAVGAGLVFGWQANEKQKELEDLCGENLACSKDDYNDGQQLSDSAHSKATLSTVFVIGGGAALVAGAIVYLTAPRARERSSARLMPTVQDRGAGVAFLGSF
jgi:tetratricopeptide (TPR) repeat protein